jgi:deoxyadenosine/deoxycytidine kinase
VFFSAGKVEWRTLSVGCFYIGDRQGGFVENLCIGIVGNIGVGKSTLIEALKTSPLADRLLSAWPNRQGEESLHTFPETFDAKVLDAFYKDPNAYAFTAQIEFFNGRLHRQSSIKRARGIVLEDRTIFEDYHIFGKAQKILGRLSEAEYIAYQRNYNLMMEKIDEPNLVVYLRADTPTLLKRIANRGRDSEKSIPSDYLNLLNSLYEEFISRHVTCPVLVVNAQEVSDVDAYLSNTCDRIVEKIHELDLRVTTPRLKDWVALPETEAALRAVNAERQLEDYLKSHHKLITVAGNVGLGKSTLTTLMHRSLRIEALYEDPMKNPLLNKFLKDKKTYCYELQRHFLQLRAKQRRQGKDGKASYVKDRSLPEDLLIFCRQFHRDGFLSANDLDLLTTEFRKVSRSLPSADLLIVLRGKPELAWQRIQQRGRAMEIEGGWSFSEIHSLAHYYRTYADDVRKFAFHTNPILEVDVNKIDLANRIHMGYLFEVIYESLKQGESMQVSPVTTDENVSIHS